MSNTMLIMRRGLISFEISTCGAITIERTERNQEVDLSTSPCHPYVLRDRLCPCGHVLERSTSARPHGPHVDVFYGDLVRALYVADADNVYGMPSLRQFYG